MVKQKPVDDQWTKKGWRIMGKCSHGRDGVGRQRQMDDRTDKKQTRKVDTPCLSSLSHPHLPATPHIHLFFRGVRRWYAHWILGICKDIVPYFCMWNPHRPSLNGLFGCSIQEFTSFGQRWVGGYSSHRRLLFCDSTLPERGKTEIKSSLHLPCHDSKLIFM